MARPPVPVSLTRAPMRTVRAKDIANVYADPRAQLQRLARGGAALRLAYGYYAITPDDREGDWNPTIEAAGAAVATAAFGARVPVLMGVSAARVHHAIPRALGVVTVAVPRQHRPVKLESGGRLIFVMRDVARLDARLEQLDELGQALVTTPEQTVLDLAHRRRGDVAHEQVGTAIRELIGQCDPAQLEALAEDQRLGAALKHVKTISR